jgi:hypothetical protein
MKLKRHRGLETFEVNTQTFVYFVVNKRTGHVKYIGLTKDLERRLYQHGLLWNGVLKKKYFVKFMNGDEEDEKKFIKLYQPEMNSRYIMKNKRSHW